MVAARPLHPLGWWLWAGALAAAAMRLTNPLLLGLIVAVVAFVVAARRSSAPWGRSFNAFLKLGLVVVVIRVLLEVAFGRRLPGHTLFELPSIDLPAWAAGVSVGGPVTVELLAQAAVDGLRLAVLLVCFGAANSLASPYRLLRCLPSVLYEAGVVVTVALAFAPEAVRSAGRLRETRRLRGRPTGGVAAVRGIALPVLEGALDRSVALAASMDARGYGRTVALSPVSRRFAAIATGVGVLGVAVGMYGVLDGSSPLAFGLPVLGLPVLATGAVALAAGLLVRGRRAARTRYRPDPWRTPEWLTVLSGVAALAGVVLAGKVDPAALRLQLYPLAVPALPVLAVAGILAALLPAVATPFPEPRVPSALPAERPATTAPVGAPAATSPPARAGRAEVGG